MGWSCAIIPDDLALGFNSIALVLVNYLPFDIGCRLGSTLPVTLGTCMVALLSRTMDAVQFVVSPSKPLLINVWTNCVSHPLGEYWNFPSQRVEWAT